MLLWPDVHESDHELSADIGPRVFQLRLRRNLTQQQLAEPRYTRSYVSSVESGRRTPSLAAISHFAGKLGVTPEELLTGRPPHLIPTLQADLTAARRALACGITQRATALYTSVLCRATRHRMRLWEARARCGLGEVALYRDDISAAEAHLSDAAARLTGYPVTTRAPVTAQQAYCLFRSGALSDAVALAETTLRTVREEAGQHADAETQLLVVLFTMYLEMGSPLRAADTIRSIRALLPHLQDPELRARAYLLSAGTVPSHDDTERAAAEQALSIARTLYGRLGFLTDVGRCHWSHGRLLNRAGKRSEAIAQLSKAREIFVVTRSAQDLMGTTIELAEAYRLHGELPQARRLADEALTLLKEHGDVADWARAHRLRGLIAKDSGDPDAVRWLHRAVTLYGRLGARLELAVTCRMLGDVLFENGALIDAGEIMRHGLRALEPS